MQNKRKILDQYFDDELVSSVDEQLLTDWLRSDPSNIREFVFEAQLHQGIKNRLCGEELPSNIVHHPFRRPLALAIAASLMVAVGIGLTLVYQRGAAEQLMARNVSSRTTATLLSERDAVWGHSVTAQDGVRTVQSIPHLKEGFAELELASGARVILDGACRFEITSTNSINLHSGQLTAHVQPQAAGFRINTPLGSVEDLGTAFGLKLSPSNGLETVVFDGEVLLRTQGSDRGHKSVPVLIRSNQIGGIGRDGQLVAVRPAKYRDSAHYITSWSDVDLIPQIEGAAEFQRELPKSLAQGTFESRRINIFLERKDLLLQQPLKMDITRPGTYDVGNPLSSGTIAAGRRVDVYLVHFDQPPNDNSLTTTTLHFGRPILGLHVVGTSLNNGDMLLGSPFVSYGCGGDYRGVEISPLNSGDTVEWSEDRQSLKLSLHAPNIDEIRIIIEAFPQKNTQPARRKIMKSTVLNTAVTFACIASINVMAAPLTNGSFEQGTGMTLDNVSAYWGEAVDAAMLPNWTYSGTVKISNGDKDNNGLMDGYVGSAAIGHYPIDGTNQISGIGAGSYIEQTVDTTAGKDYVLSFWQGMVSFVANTVRVRAEAFDGSTSLGSITNTITLGAGEEYQLVNLHFRAASVSTRIRITCLDPGDQANTQLDNVRLEQVGSFANGSFENAPELTRDNANAWWGEFFDASMMPNWRSDNDTIRISNGDKNNDGDIDGYVGNNNAGIYPVDGTNQICGINPGSYVEQHVQTRDSLDYLVTYCHGIVNIAGGFRTFRMKGFAIDAASGTVLNSVTNSIGIGHNQSRYDEDIEIPFTAIGNVTTLRFEALSVAGGGNHSTVLDNVTFQRTTPTGTLIMIQ